MEALKSIALPPGFGFHPTDVELISHYLKRKNQGLKVDFEVIPELDIYKREPWDLPACCQIPTRDSKWHFFTSRDRKYPNGSRSNRATEAGYWKSTGKDRNIRLRNQIIGTKKTLVFHEGRPPYGKRTDWIMHEYYMDEKESKTTPGIKDAYVLCRITKRNGFAVEGEKLSPRTKEVDGQKIVNDIDASLQEGVVQEESSPSASTEDLDAWFEELFDPNFDGSIKSNFTDLLPACTEPKLELQTGLSTLVPKDEPLDFSFLPEEIKGILHDDFTDMPDITELLKVDCNSTLSPNHQMKFGTEDFKKIPIPSENAQFPGIRLRRRYGPAAENLHHRIKLQVQTSKMESRNSASVCQTFESAHVNHCISSNSKPRHLPNLEVDRKLWFRKTKLNCIRGFAKEFWRFLSRCLTDRIGCCFLRVCLIGTAALIIYFLLHNCPRFLENFPALGL